MRDHISCALALIIGAMVLVHAVPAKVHAQSILESVFGICEPEITTHCANVFPGNGQVAACLYAHRDKLGGDCGRAFHDLHAMFERLFGLIVTATQECVLDIGAHCPDPGAGPIFSCLASKRAELAPNCAEAVERLQLIAD